MKQKIIAYKALPAKSLEKLQTHFEVFQFNGINENNKTEFYTALKKAHGMIGTSSTKMTAETLDRAPDLKAISTISVGTDQFDLEYLSQRNIAMMHTPEVLNETTADTIFTLILCSARRAIELSNMVRDGRWTSSLDKELFGSDVHGKTLGIIGMGRIGCAIAKRAHFGFNMNIQYSNRNRDLDAESRFQAKYLDMASLLKSSDFICVMTPLTPETEKLIGESEFSMMKKSAIFINGSRGKVIDEAALIKALQNKTIQAAGLDVFEVEPLPANSPLCELDNAVLFPHIGSATTETRSAMIDCAVNNLINALQGDISENCANAKLMNT